MFKNTTIRQQWNGSIYLLDNNIECGRLVIILWLNFVSPAGFFRFDRISIKRKKKVVFKNITKRKQSKTPITIRTVLCFCIQFLVFILSLGRENNIFVLLTK